MFNQFQNQQLYKYLDKHHRKQICIGSLVFIGKLMSRSRYTNSGTQTELTVTDIKDMENDMQSVIRYNDKLINKQYMPKLTVDNNINNIGYNDLETDRNYILEVDSFSREGLIDEITKNADKLKYIFIMSMFVHLNTLAERFKIVTSAESFIFFNNANELFKFIKLSDKVLKDEVRYIRLYDLYRKYLGTNV